VGITGYEQAMYHDIGAIRVAVERMQKVEEYRMLHARIQKGLGASPNWVVARRNELRKELWPNGS
jgi:hypothetical protein